MICGSRCLPHVPPRVLPKFVDPAKQQRDLAACIGVARDRLAVDDARAHRQHRDRRGDLSEASGKVDAFSGKAVTASLFGPRAVMRWAARARVAWPMRPADLVPLELEAGLYDLPSH